MSSQILWPLICLGIGLTLLLAEVFVPSGGLIGLLALGFLGVGIYLGFTTTTHGLLFLVALAIMMPLTLAAAVQLWPRSPMAKYIFLTPPTAEESAPEIRVHALEHLIGQFGRALTPLRPSGLVDFEGRRLDGMSEEGLIPAGALVRAVQVRSGQIIVRAANDQTLDELLS
jgi:membrane-bound ClpP family serine protease